VAAALTESGPVLIAQSSPTDGDCAEAVAMGQRQHTTLVTSPISNGDRKDRVKYDKVSSVLVSLVGVLTWHDMISLSKLQQAYLANDCDGAAGV